jgi:GNAT superfamily N-acetyltransferase
MAVRSFGCGRTASTHPQHWKLRGGGYGPPVERALTIAVVDPAAVRPLRQRLLRPGQAAEELVYPGDALPGARHFAAVLDGSTVGIASVSPEPVPGSPDPGAWRVRGMATMPEHRERGVGAALLDACLEHAAAQGGRLAWCNARTPAAGFYARFGFAAQGGEFELPGIGPHLLMTRAL